MKRFLGILQKKLNGKYFRATDLEGLASIYDEIDNLEKSVIEVKEFNQYKELYGYFIIPAFFLSIIREILRLFVFKLKF